MASKKRKKINIYLMLILVAEIIIFGMLLFNVINDKDSKLLDNGGIEKIK